MSKWFHTEELTSPLKPFPTTDEAWDDEAAKLMILAPDLFWTYVNQTDIFLVGNIGLVWLDYHPMIGDPLLHGTLMPHPCSYDEARKAGQKLIKACKRFAQGLSTERKIDEEFKDSKELLRARALQRYLQEQK